MRRGRELAQWPWSAAPQFSGFPVHKDAGCRLQTMLPDSRDQSFFSLDSACELAAQRKPDTQYSPLPHTFLDECVPHGVPKRLLLLSTTASEHSRITGDFSTEGANRNLS